MNQEKFDKILERRIELTKAVLSKKRAEYAGSNGDRLHNFRRAASMLNCTPEKALMGMATKHFVSILDMVDATEFNPGYPPPFEVIEEKLGDAINCLILLEAMLKERHE